MGTVLSKYHSMPKGTVSYPSICIDHVFPEELPILLDAMPEGDLPILVEVDGGYTMLEKKVSRSPLCLEKLLRVYSIVMFISETKAVQIDTVEQLMDLEDFNWTQS